MNADKHGEAIVSLFVRVHPYSSVADLPGQELCGSLPAMGPPVRDVSRGARRGAYGLPRGNRRQPPRAPRPPDTWTRAFPLCSSYMRTLLLLLLADAPLLADDRSEERRVGKERRCGRAP